MTLQLLVAAVNKNALELAEEMQIDSDAIIVSQGDAYSYEEHFYKKHKLRYFAMAERGVGLSRNTALNTIRIISNDFNTPKTDTAKI